MNNSKSFNPNSTSNPSSPSTHAPQRRSTNTSILRASSSTETLAISLPAFEFYNLGMGSVEIQLPVAETTTIHEINIPQGAIATVHFEYTGAFSRSRKGNIDLLMMSLLSVNINNQTFQVQSNTVSLSEFADPQNPPVIYIGTTARMEVPIETTLLFEVEEMNTFS